MDRSSQNTELEPPFKDGLFFFDDTGESLSFILCLKNYDKIKQITKIIEERFGCVKTLKEFGKHEAVLVEDECTYWRHSGDVFKVSYIEDCVKQKKLLNLSNYRRNSDSNLVDGFNYMDIFYGKLFSWNSIPDKYIKKKNLEDDHLAEKSAADILLMDSSDDEDLARGNRTVGGDRDKRTRSLFSRTEKRAMVDYIFKRKKAFDQLKGNLYWRRMESDNVCPIRTWQSMKNHFIKTLVYELRAYDIPQRDFDEFKRWFCSKSVSKKGGCR